MKDRLTIDEVIEHCDSHIRNANSFAEVGLKVDKSSKQYLVHLQTAEWLKELKEYKTLEEQGLLLRLPCKVGDTVFCLYDRWTKCSEHNEEFDEYACRGCECKCDSKRENYIYEQRAYSLDWIVTNLSLFGKIVFLTREEAEKALEKMKGGAE